MTGDSARLPAAGAGSGATEPANACEQPGSTWQHDPNTCSMCNATEPKGFYCPELTGHWWCPTCGDAPVRTDRPQICSDGFHFLARPKLGDMHIRPCRGHFHLCWAMVDEDGDVGRVDVSGCLTLAQATSRLMRP